MEFLGMTASICYAKQAQPCFQGWGPDSGSRQMLGSLKNRKTAQNMKVSKHMHKNNTNGKILSKIQVTQMSAGILQKQ